MYGEWRQCFTSTSGQQQTPSNCEQHGHPAAWRVKTARSSPPHHVEPEHSSSRSHVVKFKKFSPEKKKESNTIQKKGRPTTTATESNNVPSTLPRRHEHEAKQEKLHDIRAYKEGKADGPKQQQQQQQNRGHKQGKSNKIQQRQQAAPPVLVRT